MLILTRRPSEAIYIGENIIVTVLGVVGNQVRFGIEAPRSVAVDRAEIHERKRKEAAGPANGNVDPNYTPPVAEEPPTPPADGNTLGLKGRA